VADEYADGLKRATKENKPVLLYFYSQYCGYCDAMDRDVLNDKEISPVLKKEIVYIRIDVDKKRDIASRYNIRGYPTIVLLEPSGKGLVQAPGYIPKKDFIKILSYLRGKHYKTTSLGEFLRS
jgi:thioredoxin 1